uniref:Uncharacterized protein n=1 Tax=Chromera velia CCMP2878 TaxID=1169474 RepID=A0A0G4GY07_9ALVE|mmetsp:Transcript_3405/g.7049  ORF Transcript_3405/g.7049 Transcript_3405/m.7049 type:complete len:118 (-) Transcript_3405:294-647(-)|eukprot:Cvel_5378.t1-p1 / transcript=Cvel_5378.t1 / gene=Cvel_5378 / organism=Chromera_velia_CCMP2878 / gene_product=hypothetical protein / transcript_product=hypothetical protein / location=Cvel_scaffold250:12116-12466(-) / protein_length=117 / sequence_SO=supercontig / SO=protein_coding / is_pseudo=false
MMRRASLSGRQMMNLLCRALAFCLVFALHFVMVAGDEDDDGDGGGSASFDEPGAEAGGAGEEAASGSMFGMTYFWYLVKVGFGLSPLLFIAAIFMFNSQNDPEFVSSKKPDFSFNVD